MQNIRKHGNDAAICQ